MRARWKSTGKLKDSSSPPSISANDGASNCGCCVKEMKTSRGLLGFLAIARPGVMASSERRESRERELQLQLPLQSEPWWSTSVKTLWRYALVLSLLLQPTSALATGGSDGPRSGFCQVYSYNIRLKNQRLGEKHMFACCNNPGQRSCKGFTYQKPSRSELFCSGHVMEENDSHWTQKETGAFVNDGQFYCGDCCGQYSAWHTCNKQFQSEDWSDCNNWVQCFHRECRAVLVRLAAKQPVKCSVPPPPLPKHYYQGPRTLPANVSLELSTGLPEELLRPKSDQSQHGHGHRDRQPGDKERKAFTCTQRQCKALPLETRCRITCCEKYCCLPDGPLEYERNGNIFEGLSTAQVTGIAIGAVALLTAVITIVILVMRRCLPGCKQTHMMSNDTQILVIEGPDDVDSDQDIENA